MNFLNDHKPTGGWRYRIMKSIVAVNHYLTGKITRRHNEELWVYLSKNPEMFEELVVRKKMEKALREGNLTEIIENWDKMASIMNMDHDHLRRDEEVDEVHLGTAKMMKDISNKLREYKDKTQHDHLPWAGYINEETTDDLENDTGKEEKKPEKTGGMKNIWGFYKKYAVAAVIILMISMGTSALFFFPNPSNEKIYAQYYAPYSFKTKNSNTFADFQKLYAGGDFRHAKEVLTDLEVGNSYEKQLKYFYTGLTEMESGNLDNAVNYFDLVRGSQPDTYIKDEALWYQGLAYLKLNQERQAYTCFKSIKNTDIRNRKKARKIIWKMR